MQPIHTMTPFPSDRFLFGGDSLGEEVLVYRPIQSHVVPLISPRVQWLLAGAVALAVLAYAAWSLLRIFPELGRLDWEGWRVLGAGFWQKAREKDMAWLPWLYPFFATAIVGTRWLWSRHLKLCISAQGVRQEHRLPLGLHHLFGQNWQVAWGEVQDITTRRSSMASGLVPQLAWVEIVLQLGHGRQRVLRPAFWFRASDPPRPRLKPTGSPSPLADPWAGSINSAQLAAAFADLRLVLALAQHAPVPGLALPWPGTAPAGPDLNRQPEALVLLGGTILVFLTGWSLMLFAPHIHLHALPTWVDRAAWALGTLALWALAWQGWHRHRAPLPSDAPGAPAQPREPLSKPALAFAAALWVAAVAFVIEPLLVHTALLGRADAWQTYRFAVADGQAKSIGAEAAHVPPIQLPGRKSRLAWIKSGSEATLSAVEGRWGVWVYNDEPLRALANQQGVR